MDACRARVLVAAIVVTFSFSCSPPTGSSGGGDGGGSGSLSPQPFSGVVYDAVTGAPVSGALVRFDTDIDTTGPGGAFEFSFSGSLGVRSRPFCVTADGYSFLYVETLDVDTSYLAELSVGLTRKNPADYTDTIRIDGTVYHAEGVEIGAGLVEVSVYGRSGGVQHLGPVDYEDGDSVEVETAVRSSDAVVMFTVTDVGTGPPPVYEPQPDFVFYAAGVDLSGAGPAAIDIIRPAQDDYDAVFLTGAAPDDTARAYFVGPYSGVPGAFVPATIDGDPVPGDGLLEPVGFSGNDGRYVAIYNPFDWEAAVFVLQREADTAFGGHGKRYYAASRAVAPGGTVALAEIDEDLGPSAYPDPDTLEYVAADAELRMDPVADADLFVHELSDISAAGDAVGTVVARHAAVVLPACLVTEMSDTYVEDSFSVFDLALPSLPPSFLESPDVSASSRLGEVYGTTTQYEGIVNVPPTGTVTIGIE